LTRNRQNDVRVDRPGVEATLANIFLIIARLFLLDVNERDALH
jgi:hypothetical protein